jgi:hypothetical protein
MIRERGVTTKRLEAMYDVDDAYLRRALPQIIALIDAAEHQLHYTDGSAVVQHDPGECPLCDSLDDLNAVR